MTGQDEKIDEILKTLQLIVKKLDVIIAPKQRLLLKPENMDVPETDMRLLFGLHSHLQRTCLTLIKKGVMSANDVAHETGRARAVESSYLNQLEDRGYLVSTRTKPWRGGPVKLFKWQPNIASLREVLQQ